MPDNVRWGVMGTANIATKVASAIHAARNSDLVAIASRSADKAADWGRRYGAGQSYGSYEALLADPTIDAVYIPLPPALHHEWTLRAAQAGKHVLCEKPIALTAAQTAEMIAACAEHQVALMDATMWMHHPRTDVMATRIPQLGTLRRVTTCFSFCWDEVPQDNIRLNPELGGGALGDLGWYCVRAINWAFGDLPAEVQAVARWYNGVDMNLSATLLYADGRVASFDCGFDTAFRQWFEIAGTDGTLVCEDFVLPQREPARFYQHRKHRGADVAKHDQPGPLQEVLMVEHLADLARGMGSRERWTKLSLDTMKVLDAIMLSARGEHRRAVEV